MSGLTGFLTKEERIDKAIKISKKWLRELLQLEQAIKSLEELYNNTDGMRAVQYKAVSVPTHKNSDISSAVAIERAEIAERLKITKIRVKIIKAALLTLDDVEYQSVYNRYVLGLSWTKVADRLFFSERWVKKLSSRGVEKVARSIFGLPV